MERQDDTERAIRVVTYLLSGPLFYGFLGWIFDQWLHTSYWVVVGIVFGLAAGVYMVVQRYGRP